MDDLALAAGVTKPVFYQHFASKRALFVAVLEDVGGRLLTVLTGATAGATTGRARVEEGFSAYFKFVESDRAAFRLLFGARPPATTPSSPTWWTRCSTTRRPR